MTVGEKIRTFREYRGLTQDQLGKLSGIHGGTIRKYELGIRNPKQEQLIKIANGLGISVSLFYDLDIETYGDIASLLFLIDERVEFKFSGEKGPDGKHLVGKTYIQFDNAKLNRFLSEWADFKEILTNMKRVAKEGDTMDGVPVDSWIEESLKRFKFSYMQDPMMLNRENGIKVRIQNKEKD